MTVFYQTKVIQNVLMHGPVLTVRGTLEDDKGKKELWQPLVKTQGKYWVLSINHDHVRCAKT